MIKATQQSERQPYDVVRQALKEVELDSSRRVELDDYVDASFSGQPKMGQDAGDKLIIILLSSFQKFADHRARGVL